VFTSTHRPLHMRDCSGLGTPRGAWEIVVFLECAQLQPHLCVLRFFSVYPFWRSFSRQTVSIIVMLSTIILRQCRELRFIFR
jgi:hypothetical protein